MSANPHKPSRNSVTSINDDGSRYAIHPADAKGNFTAARRYSALFLIVLYASLPWIQINGYPAIFLDTDLMRFHFFGLTFGTQDLWLAFFLITGLGFGLFYVTSLFGRVWCGWACPQTIFLEHVYRRIERWIEGDAPKRKQLEAAPWNARKLGKRALKHGLYLIISAAIAHLFMSYFVSLPKVWDMISNNPTEHWGAFLFILIYSGALYFNFTWFREQLCIIICPYGRLQSALLDDHSLVIGYDEKRGEPRGKATLSDVGACVDCNKCVQVCPTGIDIRQGLQMECIGCAACIDACDSIMDKLKRDRGLIRYDSVEGLSGKKTKFIRPRTILYTFLMLLGITVFLFSIQGLSNVNMNAWRPKGDPYFVDAQNIRNQFMVRLINTDNNEANLVLKLEDVPEGLIIIGIDGINTVEGNGELVKPVILQMPTPLFKGEFELHLTAYDENGNASKTRDLRFLGPQTKDRISEGGNQ